MRNALVTLALALALAMAGCSGTTAPDDPSDGRVGSTSGTGTVGPVGTLTARLGAPRSFDLFLSEAKGLDPQVPAAGSLAAGTPVTSFATGLGPDLLRFESAPFETAVLIDGDVTATMFVHSAGPLVSNTALDFAAWLGRPGVNPLFTLATHDPVLAPGSVHEYGLTLSFDGKRGMLVPAGEPLVLFVTADFTASQDVVLLLVGGDTPSRLNVTVRDYGVDPLDGIVEVAADPITGQAGPGSNFAGCDPAPGTTSLLHPVAVPADARSLRLALAGSGTALPGSDLDMVLSDGGQVVAGTGTPFQEEGIFLAEETLAGLQGKTLDLAVYACQQGVVPYEVKVWTG